MLREKNEHQKKIEGLKAKANNLAMDLVANLK